MTFHFKISRLRMLREIIDIHYEGDAKHVSALCGENVGC
jgi:hypothetical protein